MSETSWPFHDGDAGTPVYEDQWSYMARQWSATGVVGAPGDANLQVYGNSSGREVHVRAGRASVRGHWFRLDAEETLAVSANSSGSPRIDRVVARLDPSADSVVLAVKAGTPAGSPAAPTLTQTDTGVWELTLAQVAVANGAATITVGNVTDERTFATVPYTPALSSMRPASPVVGQRIYETDTGLDKVWNGSSWSTPDLEMFTALTPQFCRAWHSGYPSQGGSVNVQTYNHAAYTDASLNPSSGVMTLNKSGLWHLQADCSIEAAADHVMGFRSARFATTPDSGYQDTWLLNIYGEGGYKQISDVRWFDVGDTVAFILQRASGQTPTIFRPAMSAVYLGPATLATV